jgi:acyl carrier protein
VKEEIRAFLTAHRAFDDATEFSDEDSLLESGVLDSVVMVDLISHLEKTYGIKIHEDDMTPENFDSVNSIVAYVTAHR